MVQGSSGLGPEAAQHHVTKILIGAREDIKYSPRAIILLIGLQIVDIKQLDEYLTKVKCSIWRTTKSIFYGLHTINTIKSVR